MDATLANTLTSEMTGFKDDLLTQFGALLPIALGVAISVAVVFAVIGWFRAIAHA